MPTAINHFKSADISFTPYTECIACFDCRMDETGWSITRTTYPSKNTPTNRCQL
jgi:hypothetical protein